MIETIIKWTTIFIAISCYIFWNVVINNQVEKGEKVLEKKVESTNCVMKMKIVN